MFGSQALLAVVAPLPLVWRYVDEGVVIVSVFLSMLLVGVGLSGVLGDLVVKRCPRMEWLFVPVVRL